MPLVQFLVGFVWGMAQSLVESLEEEARAGGGTNGGQPDPVKAVVVEVLGAWLGSIGGGGRR